MFQLKPRSKLSHEHLIKIMKKFMAIIPVSTYWSLFNFEFIIFYIHGIIHYTHGIFIQGN